LKLQESGRKKESSAASPGGAGRAGFISRKRKCLLENLLRCRGEEFWPPVEKIATI